MTHLRSGAATVLVALALGPLGVCRATTVSEVGDAGSLLASAQVITIAADEIAGTMGATTDVDLYGFDFDPGAPTGAWFATTVGLSSLDTQLFLFDSAGYGIATCDDVSSSVVQSRIDIAALAKGTYYLGITTFNNDPLNSAGLIFPSTFPGQFGATGPGGGSPLDGWSASGSSGGSYAISMSTTAAAAVPEPCSLAFLGFGAGLAAWRRRRGS